MCVRWGCPVGLRMLRWRVIEYGVSALRGGRRMAVGSSGGTGATAPTRARRSAGTRARRSAATARTRSPRSAATAGWAPTAEPCLAGTAPPPTAGPEGTGGQGAVAGGAWPGAGGRRSVSGGMRHAEVWHPRQPDWRGPRGLGLWRRSARQRAGRCRRAGCNNWDGWACCRDELEQVGRRA